MGSAKNVLFLQPCFGTFIEITIVQLQMICNGQNQLLIIDGNNVSKSICGTKQPVIRSTGTGLDIAIVIGDPGPNGARVQIGYSQTPDDSAKTVREFNATPTKYQTDVPKSNTERKYQISGRPTKPVATRRESMSIKITG